MRLFKRRRKKNEEEQINDYYEVFGQLYPDGPTKIIHYLDHNDVMYLFQELPSDILDEFHSFYQDNFSILTGIFKLFGKFWFGILYHPTKNKYAAYIFPITPNVDLNYNTIEISTAHFATKVLDGYDLKKHKEIEKNLKQINDNYFKYSQGFSYKSVRAFVKNIS